jgi:hypothetical protein
MSLKALKRGVVAPERAQIPIRFVCQACRQLGFGVCERNLSPIRNGWQPVLISVSSGFSIRTTGSGGEIVCGCCQGVVAL